MEDMARTDVRTDVIQVEDQFYIRAESSLADAPTLVLLHNDTFAIFDRYGDIQPMSCSFKDTSPFFSAPSRAKTTSWSQST